MQKDCAIWSVKKIVKDYVAEDAEISVKKIFEECKNKGNKNWMTD